jgi:HK97 family phage prohead protease
MKIVLNDEGVKNDYGFKIRNAGIDLSRFNNNPVVLYNHKDSSLPIGKVTNLGIEGNLLVGEIEFDKEDTNDDVQSIIGKYERGFMKAFSMGIMINRMVDASFPNGDDFIATESELYELSCVTISSNKNAVKLMNKEGVTLQGHKGELVQLSFNNGKIDFSTIEKSEMVDLKKLAGILGLPETASQTEIESAATAVKAELTAKTSELTNLKSAQIDAVIKEGETKGFINDANREDFKAMLSSNFVATKRIIDAVEMPKTPTTEGGKIATLKSVLEGNAGKVEAGSKVEETFDYLQRHNPAKLTELKSKQPDEYARLVADYSKGVRHKS